MAGVLAGASLFAVTRVPILQQRFFLTDSWDPSKGIEGLNTAGRNVIWPTVYVQATRQPVIGHGLGTARRLVAQTIFAGRGFSEYHPHNEYLQVFHDLGLVGVILLMGAWITAFGRTLERWRRARTNIVAKWNMAACLSVSVVLLGSITDNVLHYPIVIVPTAVLMSIAELTSMQLVQTPKMSRLHQVLEPAEC